MLNLFSFRINRRFFKMEGSKYANPPPGSVVDHTVMKKAYYDFLLVSQHVTQASNKGSETKI